MVRVMEGIVRSGCLAALTCITVAAMAGCGSQEGAVTTEAPAATFAPAITLDARERWFPTGAEWFIDRSVLKWSMNLGCPDRVVAVGRELKTANDSNALDPRRLGRHDPYTRSDSSARPECRFLPSPRFRANQHVRPFDDKDPSLQLAQTEGFYLNLKDEFRAGPRAKENSGPAGVDPSVPVYAETKAEQVNGKPGVRISYWTLYGRHQPNHGFDARYWEPAHEGDWERFDVLLQHEPGSDDYAPVAVSARAEGRRRRIAWDDLRLVGGTHPAMDAGRWDHELTSASKKCSRCTQWQTWHNVKDLTKQPWYGYGGAWGEFYSTDVTSGPIGPHPRW
jgi:hypothetical protein